MLIQLCQANFSTTEKSYFLFIFNLNLSGNIMSSCDIVKAQSGNGIVHLGMLNQLCQANFSTTEKSYFLLIFNLNLSGNIMSSCDIVKAQSGNGIVHFLLAA